MSGERLVPPPNGVTVRMYRQGHGDCFLIACPRKGGGEPYYVMIDCGYKPGSEDFLDHGKSIGDVVEHLHAACAGHIDLAILTHEHQDHLNGIWKPTNPYFADFEIDEAWVAWTENPGHPLAKELRKRHHDQLLGLIAARAELAKADETDSVRRRLDALLGFEVGGTREELDMRELLAAASDPERSVNKQALKLVKDKAGANRGALFLRPGGKPRPLEGAAGIRAFVLGPPEAPDLIADEDPRDGEGFPQDPKFSFAGAVCERPHERSSPFRRQFSVPLRRAFNKRSFFATHYGKGGLVDDRDRVEVADNPAWRRIDNEWLYSAETLALKLNRGINNTSLVMAFELPKSKKVLFFAADAQRGNWISWKDVTFEDGDETVSAKDLLGRAVLYKVGHHGSHNATLFGSADEEHPNLEWMGHGSAAAEFTAMITAVKKWATTKNTPPWVHPLPSIRAALALKTRGRVFQTDENKPGQPGDVSDEEWKRFTDTSVFDKLYFDWTVRDE
jgi:beta-lactamase superfamily II metal-dependent hydrolase